MGSVFLRWLWRGQGIVRSLTLLIFCYGRVLCLVFPLSQERACMVLCDRIQESTGERLTFSDFSAIIFIMGKCTRL